MASELVVSRPDSRPDSRADVTCSESRVYDVAALEAETPDMSCVVCGDEAPEPGACCSSRCAGEAQRQLRRNAVRLRRLQLRDAQEQRLQLAERNGRLMSAILRWRPEQHRLQEG